MRLVAAFALVATLSGCAVPSATTTADPEAEALARAESAFAANAQASGVKAAFLGAMADDATLFRPGPVNGKSYVASRPESPITLEWRPQRVMVAGSGELGYSSGPSTYRAKAEPQTPHHGQFFSVWKKSAAGRWEVLIDHGVGHADPVGWTEPLVIIARDAASPPSETVIAAETRFSRACETDGIAAAYRAFGSNTLRVLRNDTSPLDGVAGIERLPHASSRWTWTASDSATAASGDLAWTMGRFRERVPEGATRLGYYVRVWRAEAGDWRIVGDVTAPVDDGA